MKPDYEKAFGHHVYEIDSGILTDVVMARFTINHQNSLIGYQLRQGDGTINMYHYHNLPDPLTLQVEYLQKVSYDSNWKLTWSHVNDDDTVPCGSVKGGEVNGEVIYVARMLMEIELDNDPQYSEAPPNMTNVTWYGSYGEWSKCAYFKVPDDSDSDTVCTKDCEILVYRRGKTYHINEITSIQTHLSTCM